VSNLLTYCVFTSTQPPTLQRMEMGRSLRTAEWLIKVVVYLHVAPLVQSGNNVLWYR